MREQMVEAISETDDQLLEKYLAGEAVTNDELQGRAAPGDDRQPVQPVICGSAFKNKGVQPLLDAVVDYLPSPLDIPPIEGIDPQHGASRCSASSDDDEPFSGPGVQDHDRPVRRPARLLPGLLRARRVGRRRCCNSKKGSNERIGRLLKMHANKREEISEVWAGDIAAAVGLKNVTTGDTICDPKTPGGAGVDELPRAGDRGLDRAEDQGRPGEAGHGARQADAGRPDLPRPHGPGHRPDDHLRHGRAAPRDHRRPPGARVQRRRQRRQAAGGLQGDDHARRPRAKARYMRQTGGRGQYGHAKIHMRPTTEADFVFNNKIVGGVDPEGVHQADRAGHQGGAGDRRWRASRARASRSTLYDGSYHDVDSSEMAFKIAGSMAFKDACKRARPVLLEPIMAVEVVTPEEYMGDDHRRHQLPARPDRRAWKRAATPR